jgi:hypothetical protein
MSDMPYSLNKVWEYPINLGKTMHGQIQSIACQLAVDVVGALALMKIHEEILDMLSGFVFSL